MQVKKTNYLVNNTPTFEVLTEDEIEAIYYASLSVLSETGVRVYNKPGRSKSACSCPCRL